MKNLFITTIFILFLSVAAFAQTETVTISKQAAVKCLADSDKVEAQAQEIAAKDKAIVDLKDVINNLKIELAKASQRATDLEVQQATDRAIMQFLLQNTTRRNKIGLIVF